MVNWSPTGTTTAPVGAFVLFAMFINMKDGLLVLTGIPSR